MASNPTVRLQAALMETSVQLQMMSSRAQQLAADLFEANQLNEALSQQLAEEQSKNVGLSSKLEEIQKGGSDVATTHLTDRRQYNDKYKDKKAHV